MASPLTATWTCTGGARVFGRTQLGGPAGVGCSQLEYLRKPPAHCPLPAAPAPRCTCRTRRAPARRPNTIVTSSAPPGPQSAGGSNSLHQHRCRAGLQRAGQRRAQPVGAQRAGGHHVVGHPQRARRGPAKVQQTRRRLRLWSRHQPGGCEPQAQRGGGLGPGLLVRSASWPACQGRGGGHVAGLREHPAGQQRVVGRGLACWEVPVSWRRDAAAAAL